MGSSFGSPELLLFVSISRGGCDEVRIIWDLKDGRRRTLCKNSKVQLVSSESDLWKYDGL